MGTNAITVYNYTKLLTYLFNSVYLYSPISQIINLPQGFTICRHLCPKTSQRTRKNSQITLQGDKKGRNLQESNRGGSLSRMDMCNRCVYRRTDLFIVPYMSLLLAWRLSTSLHWSNLEFRTLENEGIRLVEGRLSPFARGISASSLETGIWCHGAEQSVIKNTLFQQLSFNWTN